MSIPPGTDERSKATLVGASFITSSSLTTSQQTTSRQLTLTIAGKAGSFGVDDFATVGVISQNSAQDPICLAAIDVVGPGVFDAVAGTHYFIYGNFAYASVSPSCRTKVRRRRLIWLTLGTSIRLIHRVSLQTISALWLIECVSRHFGRTVALILRQLRSITILVLITIITRAVTI